MKFRKVFPSLILIILMCLVSMSSAQVKVLMYHAHENLGFVESAFITHMDFLKDNGYHTITVSEFYEWHENAHPLPIQPIMITFDDNYIDVYDVAYPILKSRQLNAVNFAHTDYVGVGGTNDHCDWIEIQEMEDAGVFYTESHTRTHPHLTSLSEAAAWDEINGSKLAIETNMMDKTCIAIAYPYGNYNSNIITQCQDAGYLLGFTTLTGYNYRSTPPFELRRENMGHEDITTYREEIGFNDLPPSPPGEGWTIDNGDPNFFVDSGTWSSSTASAGYYGYDYVSCAGGSGTAVVRWAAYLPESQSYNVYAWWTSHTNHATNAKYDIYHTSGVATVEVDQRSNGGQWNLLGQYSFSTTEPAAIYLSNDADGYVIADGVWFEPTTNSEVRDWLTY